MTTTRATQGKPTPGPWSVKVEHYNMKRIGFDGDVPVLYLPGIDIMVASVGSPHEECLAVADLIAEAGTVYHETGLTPRQLADQRAELLAALDEYYSQLDRRRANDVGATGPEAVHTWKCPSTHYGRRAGPCNCGGDEHDAGIKEADRILRAAIARAKESQP